MAPARFCCRTPERKRWPRSHRLLTTVAWEREGKREYALEGSIFIAGSVVQWLRDGLGIIRASEDVEKLALSRSRQRRGVSGAGLHRAWRAALGRLCAGNY